MRTIKYSSGVVLALAITLSCLFATEGTEEPASTDYRSLVRAIYARDLDSATRIIQSRPEYLNPTDSKDTPLCMAIRSKGYDIAIFLVEEGADVNARGLRGYTPLHWAAYRDNVEVVDVLVSAGADVNAQEMYEVKGRMRQYGSRSTPLCKAAGMANWKIVRALLERGARIVPGYEESRQSALHSACHTIFSPDDLRAADNRGNFRVIEALVEHGGDINGRNNVGYTPLHIAVQRGQTDMVRYLLRTCPSVDPTETGPGGNGVLHLLVTATMKMSAGRRHEMVSILVEAGADRSHLNGIGECAFETAVREGFDDEELLDMLLPHAD